MAPNPPCQWIWESREGNRMELSDTAPVSWFTVYIAVLISVVQLILLVFVMALASKIHKLITRIDELSENAGNFVRMGMQYFRAPKKPK